MTTPAKPQPAVHCSHTEMAPIESLVPFPRNPNTHSPQQIALLAKIIMAQGWRNPVTVSNRSGFIVAGHGRYLSAQALGCTHVPIDRQDFETEAQEWAHMIADNRIAELSEIDEALMKDLLQEMDAGDFDMDLTGFSAGDLETMMTAAPPADAEPQIDRAAELAVKWGTATGQIWRLGEHHLLICGESNDPAVVARLFADGRKARLVWTDPPYGVKYGEKLEANNPQGYKVRSIENDNLSGDDLTALIRDAYKNAAAHSLPGAAIYAAAAVAGDMLLVAIQAFKDSGFTFKWQLVWLKDQLVLSRSDYHFRHENILYGWKEDAGHFFTEDRTQDSVFVYDRPKRSEEHPMMKPVELVAHMVRNSSAPGDVVYDCFSGSGCTLLACESTGRVSRGAEKSPGFVAVQLERFQAATGITPTLEASA